MRPVLRCSLLLACFLLMLTTVEHTQASYTLRVNLHQYSNSAHSKANGFCCDRNITCMSSCINQFTFCLRLPTEPDGTCSLGEYQSSFINSDVISFSQESVVANPVIFKVNSSWSGAVELLVRVDDELTPDEADPLVLELSVPVNISHNPQTIPISRKESVTHTNGRAFLAISFELECGEGFYGSDCGVFCIPRDNDLGHFTCDSNGNIMCLEGFNNTSTNCTQCLLSDGCSSTGGYCNSTDGCVCMEEFSGEFCDIDLRVCRTEEASCMNGGTCVFNQTAENFFSCICPEDYAGLTCDTDLNMCRTGQASCANGSSCVFNQTAENLFSCICPEGYAGLTCETDLNICRTGQASCANRGTCVFNQTAENLFSCICPEGYAGLTCETDLNMCRTGQASCANGGTCVFNQTAENFFYCICPEDYAGLTCETDLNMCRTGRASCANGGSCVFDLTLENKFECNCSNNFSGASCEIDLDVCGHTSPCLNNGDCENSGPDNFTCICREGFDGKTCTMETDECVQNVCKNGAICKDLHLDFECECSRGFEGRFCESELDGCIRQTCLNNGTCQNNLGDFICLCINGFSGRNCEVVDGSGGFSLSRLMGPIIGGSIASGVLLLVIICLLITLLCIVKQRNRRKLVINSFSNEESDKTVASSQQIFSVDNPTFADMNSCPHSPHSRFDNPIYDEAGRRIPTVSHYCHLNPRNGSSSNIQHSVLSPKSSSVVDLFNSMGDYSTLDESMRTQSTTASYQDHKYEQIAGTGHFASSVDNVDNLHYSTLNQSEKDDAEIVLATMEGSELPHIYESNSISPDSASETVNYDHLVVRREGEMARVREVSLTESDCHDYDSAECGVYANTEKKDLEALYANALQPETEALYDTIN